MRVLERDVFTRVKHSSPLDMSGSRAQERTNRSLSSSGFKEQQQQIIERIYN